MSAQRSRTVIRPLAELAALATALVLTGCGGGSTASKHAFHLRQHFTVLCDRLSRPTSELNGNGRSRLSE